MVFPLGQNWVAVWIFMVFISRLFLIRAKKRHCLLGQVIFSGMKDVGLIPDQDQASDQDQSSDRDHFLFKVQIKLSPRWVLKNLF